MTRKDGTERDATRRNWAELGGTGLDGTRALPHQSVYGVTDKPQRGDGRTIDERVAPPLPAKAQGAVVPARIHRPQQTHACQFDKIEVVIEQRSLRVAASQQQDRAAQARARHSVGTRDSNLAPHAAHDETTNRLPPPLAGDSSVHTSPQNGSATVAPTPDPASPFPVRATRASNSGTARGCDAQGRNRSRHLSLVFRPPAFSRPLSHALCAPSNLPRAGTSGSGMAGPGGGQRGRSEETVRRGGQRRSEGRSKTVRGDGGGWRQRLGSGWRRGSVRHA